MHVTIKKIVLTIYHLGCWEINNTTTSKLIALKPSGSSELGAWCLSWIEGVTGAHQEKKCERYTIFFYKNKFLRVFFQCTEFLHIC